MMMVCASGDLLGKTILVNDIFLKSVSFYCWELVDIEVSKGLFESLDLV
jgi:hypothetical protein